MRCPAGYSISESADPSVGDAFVCPQAESRNLTTHQFERIQQRFGVGDSAIAILDLSKDKLTSTPDRCGGHGMFFTSRQADVFDLHANHRARGRERHL